jgi:chaperonin GroEL (HSP60 family)
LQGAGRALDAINVDELVFWVLSDESRVAIDIFRDALRAPLTQIIENAGLCVTNHYNGGMSEYEGYNVKTGETGDLIKMGVIDPLKVTRSALQNAVSVAVTILSTNAIITMARSYDEK